MTAVVGTANPLMHDLAAALDPVVTAQRVGMVPDLWQAGVLHVHDQSVWGSRVGVPS